MAFWLVKSEPNAFSWDDLVKAGATGEPWTGIRNHTAKLNLMAMKKGDGCFFYHSNIGLAVVGVAEVVREAYPDPTAPEGSPWVCVDLAARTAFPHPVTLAAVKAEPKLAQMSLVTSFRLSVQPVTSAEWALVRKIGGLTARS
jgi:predicted RNA-binding protein with PUA-like domain